MKDTEKKTRVFLILNCLALFVIALNLTAPVHESTHLLTQMAAGMDPYNLSFGCADTVGTARVDLDSVFWRIMFAGSAALMNIVIGLVCFVILRKARLGPLSRVFVLQLTLLHLCMGFGYFLRDSIAYNGSDSMGDWGKVIYLFNGSAALRIVLFILGMIGYLLALSVAYLEAYHFISDSSDKAERRQVASAIYLIPYIFNVVVYTLLNLTSPIGIMNAIIISGILNLFGYLAFLWGYLFVGHMVKPPKESIYYFSPCAEKKPVLWIVALALVLIDAFILCPGIYF